MDGGTARMKDLDGAGKRRFGIRFFPGCSGSWVWCQGRWIVSEISWDCSRLSSLIRSGQRGLEVHAESGQTGMGGVSGSLEMPVERALQIAWRKVSGRSVGKVMDPSRYCIAGSRSDQNFLRSPGSSLMFPMEKTEAVSRSMYAWWAAARHVSEQLLNAMWKVERVVSSTLVMAGRCQEISAPECCHAAIARWTATIRSTPSLTVRRQFGWECRALGSGLWTAFGEGFDGALPCFGALSEAVRRGEDGGGFGMESGGGWSDAERARQALIQVDRNDPINTPSLTVRRQFGWECRALGSGLWTAFGQGFDGALPCFGALSEAVRRGEDGGGFGMESGGGWSDAERARQALIQVDRNDPINTPSLTVRRQFGWECRALGSGLWTAFGEGFDGALPCFGALSEAGDGKSFSGFRRACAWRICGSGFRRGNRRGRASLESVMARPEARLEALREEGSSERVIRAAARRAARVRGASCWSMSRSSRMSCERWLEAGMRGLFRRCEGAG